LYSIKARALLHAHLSRIPLNPETLDKDRQYIVKKCPYLIQEMVACVHQVILLAYARRGKFFFQYNFVTHIYMEYAINDNFFYSTTGTNHNNYRELYETVSNDRPRILGV